jgi:hypothetical protein
MDIYANKNMNFHNYVINIHSFNPITTRSLQYHVRMKLEKELKSKNFFGCFLGFMKFQMKKREKEL